MGTAIRHGLLVLAELTLLFVGISFALALFQRRFGEEQIRTWLGGPPWLAALKGIALGVVTPFCTCSAIPMLAAFIRAGVRPAGYAAFIVAAPVLDPILFTGLAVIVDVQAAVVYTLVVIASSALVALLAEAGNVSRMLKPIPVSTAAGPQPLTPPDAACRDIGPSPWSGIQVEFRPAVREAMSVLRRFAPLMVVGVLAGIAITEFISTDWVASVAGSNAGTAVPLAALIGIPLYVNAELFIPIGDALHTSGVGLGAIVALTIAGVGASVPEFVMLGRMAQTRLVAGLGLFVLSVAIGTGLIVNLVL